MTDRGLPFTGGASACPFVAFEHERDERATSPDHRHRCFAEPSPAPRALAHQEAYCLSSAFPVCPTFQDWARREAARTREGGTPSEPTRARPVEADSVAGAAGAASEMAAADPSGAHAAGEPAGTSRAGRDWTAPPPWLSDDPEAVARWRGEPPPAADDEARWRNPASQTPDSAAPPAPPAPAGPTPPSMASSPAEPGARGLSGSVADQFAGPARAPDGSMQSSGQSVAAASAAAGSASRPATPDEADFDEEDLASLVGSSAGRDAPSRGHSTGLLGDRRPKVGDARPRRARDANSPSWEQPRRLEAYPAIKTPMSMPSLSPLVLGAVAVLVAAAALFFLPAFLGVGGPDSTASPSPSAGVASPSPIPTPSPTPEPTQTVHVVQPGETLSRIATLYGLSVEDVLAANPEITDPDRIGIGDAIIIPTGVPSELPGSSPRPAG